MTWISLALLSMVFLGFYEISKKHALSGNAVIPVLVTATAFGSGLFVPIIIGSAIFPEFSRNMAWTISSLTAHEHALIIIKAVIVAMAWILNFGAFKHLPISIAAPISIVSPLLTVIGALLFFGERLAIVQYAGIAIVLSAYYFLSRISAGEGVHFLKNKWVLALTVSALLNASSALYDKFLIPRIGAINVQAWFSVYMLAVLLPVYFLLWFRKSGRTGPCIWRWSIPLVGILLLAADFAYFHALADRHALIAVIETVRRCSIAIAFLLGSLFFHESRLVKKGAVVLFMLAGVALLFGASNSLK